MEDFEIVEYLVIVFFEVVEIKEVYIFESIGKVVCKVFVIYGKIVGYFVKFNFGDVFFYVCVKVYY